MSRAAETIAAEGRDGGEPVPGHGVTPGDSSLRSRGEGAGWAWYLLRINPRHQRDDANIACTPGRVITMNVKTPRIVPKGMFRQAKPAEMRIRARFLLRVSALEAMK